MCVYKICFIFIIQALLIQKMHYVQFIVFVSFFCEEIIHRLVIVKTFSTINKVTILIIIGCVIWVCHDHYIILCCFCSHIIITDYYLPMSTPLNLADHDRISLEFLLLSITEGKLYVNLLLHDHNWIQRRIRQHS